MTETRKPFFYDVTLRDGNQALPKPWNNAQKKDVYLLLLKLGVQGAEVGFPASSEMDFESVMELAKLTAQMAEDGDETAKNVVVSRPCSLHRKRYPALLGSGPVRTAPAHPHVPRHKPPVHGKCAAHDSGTGQGKGREVREVCKVLGRRQGRRGI